MPAQPTVRQGATGPTVTLLQQRLVAQGFNTKVDGSFGPSTETAVEQFQASSGLDADGIVGPMTWSLLMSTGQATTPADVLAEQRAWLTSQIPADTDPKARAVLTVAIYKLGCKEIPDGSNGGPEIADIVGGDGKPPSAYYVHWGVTDPATLATLPPWCAIFVSWAMKVGLHAATWKDIPLGEWLGGAQQIETWARKHNTWMTPICTRIPAGSLFTISRDGSGSDPAASTQAGHVGFVVCDNADGTVTTCEGNVSSQVGSHRRSKTSLRGVIRWW